MSRRHWTCTHQHSTQCAAPQEGALLHRQVIEHSALIGWWETVMSGTQRTDWMKGTVCWGVGHMQRHLDQDSNQGGVRSTHLYPFIHEYAGLSRWGGVFSVFPGVLVHSVPLCVPVNLGRTIGKHLGLLVDPSGSCSARRATLPRSAMTTQWEILICLW